VRQRDVLPIVNRGGIVYGIMLESIVIDTNVLVSALRSKQGASFKLLNLVGRGLFETVVSVPLMLEYEDVLSREYLALPPKAVDDVLDYLCAVSSNRRIFYLWRPVLKDLKDDLVLELAVEAQCTSIVTYNTRHFVEAEMFGIKTETPLEFLTRLELL